MAARLYPPASMRADSLPILPSPQGYACNTTLGNIWEGDR